MARFVLAISILCLGLAACAQPGTGTIDAGTDAGIDAGTETSVQDDTVPTDTGVDADDASVPEAVSDTEPDTAVLSCPGFEPGVETGVVESPELVEASGLVHSRKSQDVLWSHNDSGGKARVFAFNLQGDHLGSHELEGASALDWEDMATGPGPAPDVDYLYLADIGDNGHIRESVIVYRVPEPKVEPDQEPVEISLSGVEAFELVYPDGQGHDAEALLIDPLSGDLIIVDKVWDDFAQVFRAQAPLSADGVTVLELVAEIDFGVVTGGDISPNGDMVILRNYLEARIWLRPKGGEPVDAFLTESCEVPVSYGAMGEAAAFAADGSGYFTLNEGANQPIHYYLAL